MRWAMISDIHANLQALDAVINKAGSVGWDRMICLGDVVGYGADPNACMERVMALCEHVIMGNHDAAALGLTNTSRFNAAARESTEWTAKELSREHERFLRELDYTMRLDDFEIVHSTPEDPPAWHYLMTEFDAAALFASFETRYLFYGHTHVPTVFSRSEYGEVKPYEPESFSPDDNSRYIINVGSVGQPRDGDPRASFAVFDTEKPEIEFYRVDYDIDAAKKRIIDAGLPRILATRLDTGN